MSVVVVVSECGGFVCVRFTIHHIIRNYDIDRS